MVIVNVRNTLDEINAFEKFLISSQQIIKVLQLLLVILCLELLLL